MEGILAEGSAPQKRGEHLHFTLRLTLPRNPSAFALSEANLTTQR